jgi:hypothetical protein
MVLSTDNIMLSADNTMLSDDNTSVDNTMLSAYIVFSWCYQQIA